MSFLKFIQPKIYRRIIALALVLNLLIFWNSPLVDTAWLTGRLDIFANRAEAHDLVILLVDQELLLDRQVYQGLRPDYRSLRARGLADRINRYAKSLQSSLANTKVEIVKVQATDDPAVIAGFLKQVYFRNLETFANYNLVGTVLVGEVPLPVVDKPEGRSVSLYPYTDFQDPIFVLNPVTNFFELNTANQSGRQPEIYHGVLNFKLENNSTQLSRELLAKFLDKNYLYRQGHADFADFDPQVFYSEPIHEQNFLVEPLLEQYLDFEQLRPEILYRRYSKKLFDRMSGSFGQVADFGNLEPDTELAVAIQEKVPTILKAFESGLREQLRALVGTGRYQAENLMGPLLAISKKDDYVGQYLFLANNLLESKIDTAVRREQATIKIPNGSKLTGSITYTNGRTTDLDELVFANNSPDSSFYPNFLRNNTSQASDLNDPQRNRLVSATDILSGRTPFSVAVRNNLSSINNIPLADAPYLQAFKMAVFGKPVSTIRQATDCRIYKGGGTDNPLDKTVRTTRGPFSFGQEAGESAPYCFLADNTQDHQVYDLSRPNRKATDPQYCSAFFGANLSEPYRVQSVETINKGALTHEACFNMRPVSEFDRLVNLKYQNRNLTPQELLTLTNPSLDLRQLRIAPNISLADIARNLPSLKDRRSELDANALAFSLLANPYQKNFHLENLDIPGVATITLKVEHLFSNFETYPNVQTKIKHVDPTPETYQAISDGEITQELPINATRYVTFLDKQGQTQELIYPNLFTKTSLTDLARELREIEAFFSSISDLDYSNYLTRYLTNQTEVYNEQFTEIQRLNHKTVSEFLNWRTLSLNQKYTTTYQQFLDTGDFAPLLGFPSTFEIAVITANSDQDNYNLSVLPEDFQDSSWQEIFNPDAANNNNNNSQSLADLLEAEAQARAKITNQIAIKSQTEQIDYCNSSAKIPLTDWFTDYLPCWLNSFKEFAVDTVEVVRSAVPSYKQTIANPEAEIASIDVQIISDHLSASQSEQAQFKITILDAQGQKIVGKPVQLTLSASNRIVLDDGLDLDPETEGIQIFMAKGDATISADIVQAGSARLRAYVGDIINDFNFNIHQELKLVPTFINRSEIAISNSINPNHRLEFQVQLQNQSGQVLPFLPPNIKLRQPQMGQIQFITEITENPQETYRLAFRPNQTAGQANLDFAYPNLAPVSLEATVKPGEIQALHFEQLESQAIFEEANPDKVFETTLFLVDNYKNRVRSNLNDVPISLSDTSKATLLQNRVNFRAGKAQVKFKLKPNTFGNLFLVASFNNLKPALHKVTIAEGLSRAEFQNFNSQALYYKLRTSTGAVRDATHILSQGKSQVVSTLTSDQTLFAPQFYIQPSGAYEQLSSQLNLTQTLSFENQTYSYQVLDTNSHNIVTVNLNAATLPQTIALTENPHTINSRGFHFLPFQENLSLDAARKQLSLDDQPILNLTPDRQLEILDQTYALRLLSDSKLFTIGLYNSQNSLIGAFYIVPANSQSLTIAPNFNNLAFQPTASHTQPSSNQPQGLLFTDRNTTSSSTSNQPSELNQGLKDDNKSLLLFSAGASAGESHRPYLGETEILLGDPTIALQPKVGEFGFNTDIGKLLGESNSEVTHILPLANDIIFADKEGYLSRYNLKTRKFYKNLLFVPSGILHIIESKVANQTSELILSTATPCFEEDPCLYQIKFDAQGVLTESLELNLPAKAKKILSFDYNKNRQEDLLVLAENHLLYLFTRNQAGLSRDPIVVGSVFNQIQPNETFQQQLALFASNLANRNDPAVATIPINVPVTPREEVRRSADGVVPTSDTVIRDSQLLQFSRLQELDFIENLTVRITDANGELLRNGDTIKYQISFRTTQNLQNALFSFPISSNETLKLNSLNSASVANTNDLQFRAIQHQQRPYLISNLSAAANSFLSFSFETTYALPASYTPQISIVQDDGNPRPDSYPDIKVILSGQDKIVYYYSQLNPETNRLTYRRHEVIESPITVDLNENSEFATNAIPLTEDLDNPPENQKAYARQLRRQSKGLTVNKFVHDPIGGLNQIADKTIDTIKGMFCLGKGCLIMPVNYAFLVPPGKTAMPIFGAGCGSFPFVWPPIPYSKCAFRQYISPTLTGHIAGASCFGPYLAGACIPYKITDLGDACAAINNLMLEALSKTAEMVDTATLGVVKIGGNPDKVYQDPDTIIDFENITVPGIGRIFTDWFSNQIEEIKTKLFDLPDLTIILPSLSSLRDYVQPDETAKNDFKDRYQTFGNDFTSAVQATDRLLSTEESPPNPNAGYLGITDALATVSAMPLFNVTLEKQVVEYPWIPDPDEFNKYLLQITDIIENAKREVHRALNTWKCYGRSLKPFSEFEEELKEGKLKIGVSNAVYDQEDISPREAEACIQLSAAFDGFFFDFTANLSALKSYRDLPKNIFEVENFIADYAIQVLGIAEMTLDRTAGFLLNNTNALIEWQNFLYDIQNLIKKFKLLIEFINRFRVACDDCLTDRTNIDFELLLETLIQIPNQLPIIEFPRLPDITLDMSSINLGIDIVLPDIEFKPKPISLPNLNNWALRLPDAIPINFDFNFARFGFRPIFTLPPAPDLGQFILDLPPLGDFQLPVFPTLPRPPDISVVIGDFILKIEPYIKLVDKVLTIICLLTKNLVPYPEALLKTKIESMTNRPLVPHLPIDIVFGFNYPQIEYSYISEFKIIVETYLNLRFDLLNELTQRVVTNFNQTSREAVNKVNLALENLVDTFQPELLIDLSDLTEDLELDASLNLDVQPLIDEVELLPNFGAWTDLPEAIHLVATTEQYSPALISSHQAQPRPKLLKPQYQQLLALREQLSTPSSSLLASTKPLPVSTNYSSLIANVNPNPSNSTTPTNRQAAYNPEQGIYFTPKGSNTVHKLVDYSYQQSALTKIAVVDVDNDNDDDIIYTRHNEIYLKENRQRRPQLNFLTTAVKQHSLADLYQFNPKTLINTSFQLTTDNRQVSLTVPRALAEETIVVDVFHADLIRSRHLERYTFVSPENDSHTTLSLDLPNQNFRLTISVLNPETNKLEVVHQGLAVTPNICRDRTPPVFGTAIDRTYNVSLYQSVLIDLQDIQEIGSNLTDLYLDINGDGQPNLASSDPSTVRQFRLNGFNQVGTFTVKVYAIDEAKNQATIDLTINVTPPNLTLNQTPNGLSGEVVPPLADMPVTIIRERNQNLEELATLTTNSQGSFSFTDIVKSDSLVIKDANNQNIFEINTKTGSLKPLTQDAKIEILTAKNPAENTVILLKNKQQTITTLTKISDLNTEAQIVTARPNLETLDNSSNLFVLNQKLPQSFELKPVSTNDKDYAGAIELHHQQQKVAIFDTNGGLHLLDNRLTVILEPLNDLTQYQWYQINFENKPILHLLPTFANTEISFTEPAVIERIIRPVITTPEAKIDNKFQDVDERSANSGIIKYLQDNSVIEGVVIDQKRYFQPNRQITRAEYAKIILRILCLTPTPSSFQRPSVFHDIPFTNNLPWFYSETKETYLQKIFTGYLGEIDSLTKLPPFKPNNPITLAEATKVILEALVNTQAINMKAVPTSEPWYQSYLQIAQDLKPYLNPTVITNSDFILTPEEARTPNKLISREEFAVIAFRALQVQNCIEENKVLNRGRQINQTDRDQLSDDQNQRQQTALPDESQTQSTSPEQVVREEQPVNQSATTNAGLYLAEIACVSCPCQYRYEYLATFRKGDKIYAVLRDKVTNQIVKQSLILNIE